MKKIILKFFTFSFRWLAAALCVGGSLFSPCFAQTFSGFDSLSTGMTSPGAYVLSLAMKDSTQYSPLYAGGHFTIAGRYHAINIAEWRDTATNNLNLGKWSSLGTGINNDVCALTIYNSYLYAGGKFDTAGGIVSSHIARWDTTALKWDSLAGSLNGNVYALCVYNNALYVGGDFTVADGDTVNRIAMWNGSAWSAVGKGFDTGAVYALTVSNDTLYAGGSFLKSNSVSVNRIAKWTGTKWDSLKGGTNNTVYALTDFDRNLYVGGAFTKSGNVTTKYLSVWYNYPFGWDSVGKGTNDTVRALNGGIGVNAELNKKSAGQGLGLGHVLLIGGNFDSAWGQQSHYMAAIWYNQDEVMGLNGPVFSLANALEYGLNYVGGRFDSATIDSVNNIATLLILGGGGIQSLSDKANITVFPNPSNGQFTIQSSMVNGQWSVEVYNVLGEKVYSQYSIPTTQYTADLSSNPNGVYLYRILASDGSLIGDGKLIIQK